AARRDGRGRRGVSDRPAPAPSGVGALGALDQSAIGRVRDEARPDPRDADELHDALVTSGFLTADDARTIPAELFEELARARRASVATIRNPQSIRSPQSAIRNPHLWVAAERLPELRAIHDDIVLQPAIEPPPSRAARTWTLDEAIVELLRGRLGLAGPTTARGL